MMATLYHLPSFAVKDRTGDPCQPGIEEELVPLTGRIRSYIEVATEEALMEPELRQYIDQKVSEEVARRFKQLSEEAAKPSRMALVASKGTLDMAYPPLILATTAASLGWEVGIFFTFYGLDILHKERIGNLKVGPVGNPAMPPPIPALPWMKVPNLVGALPGMTAMATTMMRSWIARAKLPTIPELMDLARECDVSLYA
jgi:peroxiredoxin family protein